MRESVEHHSNFRVQTCLNVVAEEERKLPSSMYKYVALFVLIGCAAAAPKPGYLAAPVVAAAPAVAVAHSVPVATSYANTYKVSYKSPLVAAAPVVAAAPAIAYAPAIAHQPAAVIAHGYAASPLAYAAHAPLVAVH
ncbi:cuticle protein 70, isoforms A and B-like [Venturia canescens]|uniref:cuticle protein 70, isoforms A and B-like n=1 Tax=Venturia canescens TaxID=32260 RepID=UPI001C9BD314|nr:cuticle protein 70, isoforms A and B-like [Venturia canescens]